MNIRSSLLARNTFLNVIGQGLPLVVAIASVPFIIRGLGTARYGILALEWVILKYLAIFDFGLGGAVTKFVAEALGRRQQEKIPTLIWSAITFQAALGVLGGLLLAAATPLLVGRILNIPAALQAEARLSLYILALSGPGVLTSRTLNGVMEANQRFDLVNAVRAPFIAVNYLLQLLGVLLGWGLPGIVALILVAQYVMVSMQFWLCAQSLPGMMTPQRPGYRELRTLLDFGKWVTVSWIVDPILVYFDRFAIGMLLTMSAVAYYTAPYEMATQLWIIPTSLAATLFPAFSALDGQGQREYLGVLVSRSVKYVLLSLGPVVIVIGAYAREILQIWLGPDFAQEGAVALQVLVVGVLINSVARVPYALVQGLGRPDITAKFHLAQLPLHLLLVWSFVNIGGIAGASVAWSLRVTIDALLLYIAACRLSSLSRASLLVERVPQTAWVLAVFGAIAMSLNAFVDGTWPRLIGLTVILSVVGVSVWHYLLSEWDRAHIGKLFRAVGAR